MGINVLHRTQPGRMRVAAMACVAGIAVAQLAISTSDGAIVKPPTRPASPATETFHFDGPVTQTVVVPEGATTAEVRAIGGKGGATWSLHDRRGDHSTGGDGAEVSGTLAVKAGQLMRIQVGEFGGDGDANINPGKGGWGATGTGGRGGGASHGDGAGGGGATAVKIADCASCKDASVLIAGGGGGAGGVGVSASLTQGGPGGSSGTTVDSGHRGSGLGAGLGGGSGAGNSGHGVGGGNGRAGGGAGGGGGAGLVGGGGGNGGGTGGGGGGGGGAGSSLHWSLLQNPRIVRGWTADGNGMVSVTWNHVAAPGCDDQTLEVPADSAGIKVQLHCAGTRPATSYRVVSLPTHGLLDNRDLTTGTFTYVPRPGFVGTDSMSFQGLTGDQASTPATVTFTVVANPQAAGRTDTYNYIGSPATVRAPDWAHFAEVAAIGGKGGGSFQFGGNKKGTYWTGGDGAEITGEFAVKPAEFVTFRVGQYGGDADLDVHPGEGGWGATGNGGRGGMSSSGDGGGGGGSSSVTVGGARVLVAGGGGGAGGRGLAVPGQEPGPGGSSGTAADPGHKGKGAGGGAGGGGGASGDSNGGGGSNGSSLGGGGGGGGGGVRGGGGGHGGGFGAGGGGGGGGGTSELAPSLINAGIRRGTTDDGNGVIRVTWLPATPECYAQSVAVERDSPGVHVQLRCDRGLMGYVLGSYPTHGFLDDRDLKKGTFTYVPTSGFTGTDILTFQGDSHGVLSAPATVTFEVR